LPTDPTAIISPAFIGLEIFMTEIANAEFIFHKHGVKWRWMDKEAWKQDFLQIPITPLPNIFLRRYVSLSSKKKKKQNQYSP